MKPYHYSIIAIVVITLLGCASTEYKTYEGRNPVFDGNGGTRSSVDGIDFWDNGDPPRKFKLMGIIDDKRPGGIIPTARLKGDIAKKAKAQGADAVVILSSGSKIRGFHTNSTTTAQFAGSSAVASGSSVSVPLMKNSTSFAVIKYLD
ncbi:MAG: hypothetical protein V4819_25765 [Verrucomicrobiota bacterium]